MSNSTPNSSSSESLVPVVVDHDNRRWSMFKRGSDALVKDLDLAADLEFTDQYEIRGLIQRHLSSLDEVFVMATETTSRGGRPGRAFYLTEEQALFIIAKSETPKATWMLKAMIAVFMKARGLVEVAAQPDAFGRLEEWERIRANVDTAGRVLLTLTGDISRLGDGQTELSRQLAAQREYLEVLDSRVNRGMPTPEQRAELVQAIGAACECRVSDRERLMLLHIAEQGPATSQGKIGAAARVSHETARRVLQTLSERCIVEVFQRDPVSPKLFGFHVIADGLNGHEAGCERALGRLIEINTSAAAVHTVPPNIPHIPLPQSQPELQLVRNAEPVGMSEREELMKTVRGICYHNGLDYHDFMSKLYIRMKFEGMDCKKTKKTSRIDYMERHNWCGVAKKMAEKMPIHEIRLAQNVGHA